jgi:replicative DNA helicase
LPPLDQYKEAQGLPAEIPMEVAILGAILNDPSVVSDVVAKLEESDFSLSSHQTIYRRMLEMKRDDLHIDVFTLRDRLKKKRELESVGDVEYLYRLQDSWIRNSNVDSYVATVKDRSRLRAIISLASAASDAAVAQQDSAAMLLQRLAEGVQEQLEDADGGDLQSVGDYLDSQGDEESIFERMSTLDGIKLGFTQCDEVTGGLQGGDLIIVAARPSAGKTAWACNVARNVAFNGLTTAFFTLEQKRKPIIRRMLSSASRVDYRDIRDANLRQHERSILLEHHRVLKKAPLYIDDTKGLTASQIAAKCSKLKRHIGLDIILIDQLSHISRGDCKERDTRLKIGEQTQRLKRLASDLNVPVVLFNQLSRDSVGKGSDNRPRLEHLKESGNIEEDADIVILLHRPEMYNKSDESLKGVGEMIVAKNREGATKVCECLYQGRIMRWEDQEPPAVEQKSFVDGYRSTDSW